MKLQKYITTVFLMFFVVILIFLTIKRYSHRENIKSTSRVIDQHLKNDSLSQSMIMGKRIFEEKCMVCHNIYKTDNFLAGFEERWLDKKELVAFIRNPQEVIKRNSYAKELKEKFGVEPIGFPELTDSEIQSTLDYIIWANHSK